MVHRHEYFVVRGGVLFCRCGRSYNAATAKRSRNNRHRGIRIEREVLAEMGIERVGQRNEAEDGRDSLFSVQVKSGPSWYSAKQQRELDKLDPAKTRLLVRAETGSHGGRPRNVQIDLSLDQLVELVGGDALVTVALHPDWLDRFGKD